MLAHHAYLIEGSTSLFDAYSNGIRATEKFDSNDPDFFGRKYETFGIEDARDLQSRAGLKKLGKRALFLIGISSITTEAQQALLKLFEEPGEGVVFIVLSPPGLFIPTLRSRFLPYEHKFGTVRDMAEVREFLASTQKQRSDMIAAMLKDDDEDTKEKVRDFLTGIEARLAPNLAGSAEIRQSLEDIQRFRNYVNDRAPSLKMILEHFAATLPVLK